MATGMHCCCANSCYASRDHKTECEIAPKSAVKKQSFPWKFIGTCCCDAVPPHRHRHQWEYTLKTYSVEGCSEILTWALIFKSFWICWSQACLKLPMYNFAGSISTGYSWKLSSSCKERSRGFSSEHICSFSSLNRSHVEKWTHT